jgi:branched-chain amino acid transport system ATP-binding protein
MSDSLELDQVIAGYKGSDILRGISVSIRPGDVVAVLGSNGVGKSTLLRAVSGQLRLRGGTRTIDGADASGLQAHQFARRGVRWLGDPRPIYTALTVEENLAVGGSVNRKRLKERREWVYDFVPILRERRTQKAASLSGGQQQLLALAQALMSEPKYLCLDEPSLGLAPLMIEQVAKLVTELAASGVGVIWAEQFPEVAIKRATQLLVLSAGRVALAGPPDTISAQQLEAAYLGATIPDNLTRVAK